ncbi:MAG: prepilin-type N-terminal cleavage/methylation domain-containing protein [Merismopedia sp. SIO2A8]|nr:prepilin-type N-terminal cleavage/methylation domain-containing protein [Merismopedia sp. SIO2A8]
MTILEVIAVMAILGILAAIAAPGWTAFANRQRANRGTDQVLQAVRKAQADAKRTRRNRTVEFVEGTATATPKLIVGGVSSNLGEGSFNPGAVQLSAVDGNSDPVSEISFASTGGLNDVDLPIHITVAAPLEGGATKCVIIRSLLGATQIGSDGECNS